MRLRMILIAVLLWAGVAAPWTAAQSSSTLVVKGRVLDAETNAPLSDTHVFVAESMNGTVTDSTGRFRLDEDLGDTSSLDDPSTIEAIRAAR